MKLVPVQWCLHCEESVSHRQCNTVIPNTLRIISCHANILAVLCYLTQWVRTHIASSYHEPPTGLSWYDWTPCEGSTKQARRQLGDGGGTTKTQRLRLSKQVWLLRWISKRFVVKTLAPPVHRNLVDLVAVQILYPGQFLTCQTSEAYRSENFKVEVEIFERSRKFQIPKLKFSELGAVSLRKRLGVRRFVG